MKQFEIKPVMPSKYLGDNVWAKFKDGDMILGIGEDHEIVMSPATLAKLLEYIEEIRDEI